MADSKLVYPINIMFAESSRVTVYFDTEESRLDFHSTVLELLAFKSPLSQYEEHKVQPVFQKQNSDSLATVVLAKHIPLGNFMAIKVIYRDQASLLTRSLPYEVDLLRKLSEIPEVAKLVVKYVEHFECDEFLYHVTRWVEKLTLAEVMKHSSERFLNEVEMQAPAKQLLKVLQAVHGQGFTHNAVSLSNIFVKRNSSMEPQKHSVILGGFSKATPILGGHTPKVTSKTETEDVF